MKCLLIHLCIGQEGASMMLALENARSNFQEVNVTVVSSLDPKRKVKSAIPTMARRLGAQFYVSKPDSRLRENYFQWKIFHRIFSELFV